MKTTWIEKLKKTGPCQEGLGWASQYETAQAAWSACERGDWMLWAWAQNCGGKIGSESHRRLVLCAVECAKTSVKYIKDENVKKLAKKSLETTKRWARGEDGVTLEDVEDGIQNSTYYDTAYACRNHPAAVFAWRAYSATCSACYAVWSAAEVADNSARSICVALNRGVDIQDKALKRFSDIIRTIQPKCPKFKRLTV